MWRPWSEVGENSVVEEGNGNSDSGVVSPAIKPRIAGTGHSLTKGQQAAVKAMLQYAKEKGAKSPVADVVKVLGVSRTSVYKVESGAIRSPGKRGVVPGKNKFRRVDDFHWKMLQREIYSSYEKNEVPTLRSLHHTMTSKDSDFSYSKTQVYRMVKALGFKFQKLDKRKKIMMSHRIVFLRDKYLLTIQKMRVEHRKLIFLDETW